jgi:hypothetical protein
VNIERIIDAGRGALALFEILRDAWRARKEPPIRIDALHVGATTSDVIERERARARSRWPEDAR